MIWKESGETENLSVWQTSKHKARSIKGQYDIHSCILIRCMAFVTPSGWANAMHVLSTDQENKRNTPNTFPRIVQSGTIIGS